ncbi:MAG: hypothetical protein ACI8PZ_006218 [Myxococcota bacterium]|jgi:hypothetical protein
MVRGWWARWVAHVERPVDVRPVAAIRIVLPIVVLVHVAAPVWLGLFWRRMLPPEAGGLTPISSPWWFIGDDLFGVYGLTATWVILVLSLLATSLGVRARWAAVIAAVAYAQYVHGFPLTDHGGGRVARFTLLALAFTDAHRCWALDARDPVRTTAGWPVDVLRWLLFLIYFGAGLAKLLPRPWHWLVGEHGSQVFMMMTDPRNGALDAATWWSLRSWFHLLDQATIVVEVGLAFMILTRWRKWWALLGAPIHVGIALGMALGHFSYIMLSLYTLLWDEWFCAAADRVEAWWDQASTTR